MVVLVAGKCPAQKGAQCSGAGRPSQEAREWLSRIAGAPQPFDAPLSTEDVDIFVSIRRPDFKILQPDRISAVLVKK